MITGKISLLLERCDGHRIGMSMFVGAVIATREV